MDICILLSNILKNAFEAELIYKENQEKDNLPYDDNCKAYEVSIDVKNLNQALYIQVLNDTCNDVRISRNQIIHTTKSDKAKHGYGTRIIKDIVEKYGGTLTYTSKEHLFITEIMFENIIM
jgi:sensor histidine kinase regulating citrate/malate metabolism